jgi:holliday junction DNA helicase RuvB
MNSDSILSLQQKTEDIGESQLRPNLLEEFLGQNQAKSNLKIFIDAAKSRKESLDHVLFYGPPGLGKTTLAQIVSREMGVGFKSTSGPIITKSGDLASIMTNLQEGDVIFIDEIHRLHTAVEEVLYSAMEDYKLDIMIGEGPSARSIKIDLPKFTLVGATTRVGLLSSPLRDRFGIPLRLNLYNEEELGKIISRDAKILNIEISEDGALEISRRSRGTPRIAIRLLKRVRDFAHSEKCPLIDKKMADLALKKMEIDPQGFDAGDYRYMKFIAINYNGGPVGIDTISAGLNEEKDTIEDTIENYLIQKGFLEKTPRGRMLTKKAFEYLKIPK